MSFLISSAYAAGDAAPASGGWLQFVFLGAAFAFMYFVMIRPQRQRQKELQSLLGSLGKGDEVVLNSGLLGKILDVDDAYLTLEVGDNVKLKFQKHAVLAVLPKGTIKSI